MTQSKKWFHIGLWKEGMKQLRLIGFLSMLILALCYFPDFLYSSSADDADLVSLSE